MISLIEKVDASLPKDCGDRLLSYDFKGDPKIYIWKYEKDKVEEKNIVMPIEAISKVNDNYFVCDDDEGSLFVTDNKFESFEPVFEKYVSPLNKYSFEGYVYTVLVEKENFKKKILYDLSNSQIVRSIEVSERILNEYTFQFLTLKDEYTLVVRDFLTGEILWEIPIESISNDRPTFSIKGIKQNILVFYIYYTCTYAVDLTTGTIIWKNKESHLLSSQVSNTEDSLLSFKFNYIKSNLLTGEKIVEDTNNSIGEYPSTYGSSKFLQHKNHIISVDSKNRIYIYDTLNNDLVHVHEEPQVKSFNIAYAPKFLYDRIFIFDSDFQTCVFKLDGSLLKRLNG